MGESATKWKSRAKIYAKSPKARYVCADLALWEVDIYPLVVIAQGLVLVDVALGALQIDDIYRSGLDVKAECEWLDVGIGSVGLELYLAKNGIYHFLYPTICAHFGFFEQWARGELERDV